MSTTATDEYRTSDLGTASYLLARGHEVRRVESQPGRWRRWFVFDASAREEARKYLNGATVEARAMYDAIRRAKAFVYGEL